MRYEITTSDGRREYVYDIDAEGMAEAIGEVMESKLDEEILVKVEQVREELAA